MSLVCMFLLLQNFQVCASKPMIFKLKHHFLNKLDGLKKGVDAETIMFIRNIVSNIDQMHKEPIYDFENKKYNLSQLIEIERAVPSASLTKCLEEAKEKFGNLVDRFLKTIQSNKKFVIELIKESCDLRNKPKSFLLNWSQTSDERKLFDENIQSFESFSTFCVDLRYFLVDLMYSCPKGWKQYVEWNK